MNVLPVYITGFFILKTIYLNKFKIDYYTKEIMKRC